MTVASFTQIAWEVPAAFVFVLVAQMLVDRGPHSGARSAQSEVRRKIQFCQDDTGDVPILQHGLFLTISILGPKSEQLRRVELN